MTNNAWKFWVFMVDNKYMITTYGLTEDDGRLNLDAIINENADENLKGDLIQLLFNVDSPFELDTARSDTLQNLCVLVTNTIIANDACNLSIRERLSEDMAASEEATKH